MESVQEYQGERQGGWPTYTGCTLTIARGVSPAQLCRSQLSLAKAPGLTHASRSSLVMLSARALSLVVARTPHLTRTHEKKSS